MIRKPETANSWHDLPTLHIRRGNAPAKPSSHRHIAYNVRSIETISAELDNRMPELLADRVRGQSESELGDQHGDD